jgi:hypothetical protein
VRVLPAAPARAAARPFLTGSAPANCPGAPGKVTSQGLPRPAGPSGPLPARWTGILAQRSNVTVSLEIANIRQGVWRLSASSRRVLMPASAGPPSANCPAPGKPAYGRGQALIDCAPASWRALLYPAVMDPVVLEAVAAIGDRDRARLKPLLHPYLHWTARTGRPSAAVPRCCASWMAGRRRDRQPAMNCATGKSTAGSSNPDELRDVTGDEPGKARRTRAIHRYALSIHSVRLFWRRSILKIL